MKIRSIALLTAAVLLAAGLAAATEYVGADQMTLNGRSRGNVAFSHHEHQKVVGDCSVCHTLFPQQTGAIDAKKDAGDLSAKQVMNTLCIKCHREKKAAGEATGPVSCSQCHKR